MSAEDLDEAVAEQASGEERRSIVDVRAESKAKKGGSKKKIKRWRKWRSLFGLASLVAIVAVILAAVQWRHAHHAASQDHTRLAAERTAGQFAQILLTFDSDHPTASLDGLQRLATPAYQPRVNSARGAAGAAQAPAGGHSTTAADVENVYITELNGGTARAVTQVSWVITTNGQSAPPVDFWLQLDLKRQAGAWKVDNVNGIAARNPTGTGSPGGAGAGPSSGPGAAPPAGAGGGQSP